MSAVNEAPTAMQIEAPPKMEQKKRCPNGSRRNKKTGLCEPTTNVDKQNSSAKPARKRCPNGTRRNKKTGLCE